MAGSIKHRHQTVVPAGGADVDHNEWNDSHIFGGGVDGQFAMRDSAQADGWRWADATVAPVAGSLSFGTAVATSSPVNLTSLGTRDWWAPTNNTNNLNLQQQPYPNRKLVGRGFLEHWWVANGSITIFTGGLLTTISATAADNRAGSALVAYGTGSLCFNGGAGAVGYGWGMRIAASTTSRTLHFGHRVWSGVVTITASLTDGSATPITTTATASAGTGIEVDQPLTFNAASSDADLIIQVILTTNSGSSPHVGLVYGYL